MAFIRISNPHTSRLNSWRLVGEANKRDYLVDLSAAVSMGLTSWTTGLVLDCRRMVPQDVAYIPWMSAAADAGLKGEIFQGKAHRVRACLPDEPKTHFWFTVFDAPHGPLVAFRNGNNLSKSNYVLFDIANGRCHRRTNKAELVGAIRYLVSPDRGAVAEELLRAGREQAEGVLGFRNELRYILLATTWRAQLQALGSVSTQGSFTGLCRYMKLDAVIAALAMLDNMTNARFYRDRLHGILRSRIA